MMLWEVTVRYPDGERKILGANFTWNQAQQVAKSFRLESERDGSKSKALTQKTFILANNLPGPRAALQIRRVRKEWEVF